jgi:hypothetical protein
MSIYGAVLWTLEWWHTFALRNCRLLARRLVQCKQREDWTQGVTNGDHWS